MQPVAAAGGDGYKVSRDETAARSTDEECFVSIHSLTRLYSPGCPLSLTDVYCSPVDTRRHRMNSMEYKLTAFYGNFTTVITKARYKSSHETA